MQLYANVDGQKRLPSKGGRGTCPCCGGLLIAHCGEIKAHHWQHQARKDCDTWSDEIGTWHLTWQGLVRPEFVEVVRGPHRADIFNGRTVVELQHSPISAEDIAAREAFYGDMVWLFDATHRFAYNRSGERAFFSFGRTKHLDLCKKPVFLDFGFGVVEVEQFTDAIHYVSGFGLLRSREWFAEAFLSDVRQPDTSMVPFVPEPSASDPWEKKRPTWKLEHDTRWMDRGQVVTFKKWAQYIWLRWGTRTGTGTVWDYEKVIDRYPAIANGWDKDALRRMKDFFTGQAVILGGLLRVLPHAAFVNQINGTVSATENLLRQADELIQAGRLPVLKDATKQAVLQKAREGEISQYGRLLRPEPVKPAGGQKSLFE